MEIVKEIKALVELKNKGELTAEEFANAKAAFFRDAGKGGAKAPTDEEKTAEGEKRRARRRSVKDWLTRIGQDCAAGQKETEEFDGYNDVKLANMFALGIKWSGPGYIADGKYAETVADFFEDGAYAEYSTENARAGIKDVFSGKYTKENGQLEALWKLMLNPEVMEWQLNVRDAKIVRYDQELICDFGFTPLISKKSGKEYECYVKLHNKYIEGESKVVFHKFCLAAGGDGFFALISDDQLEDQWAGLGRI